MSDAAEARALAKTLDLRAHMGTADDGSSSGGASNNKWGAARASVALESFAELQARALAAVLGSAERRARSSATTTRGGGWRAPMASLDGYGYGRAFSRLAARWQFAGETLRDARQASKSEIAAGQSSYQRFLGRLGAVSTNELDDSAGSVALFGLVLRLQSQAVLNLLSLASANLKEATGPGTREDEDGVYGSVAICRYALHRMPNKTKIQKFDPAAIDNDGTETLESGRVAKAGVRLRVAQAGWAETIEVLEARALACIVDASAKLNGELGHASTSLAPASGASGGATTSHNTAIVAGFGLRDEAQRVLDETLHEYGHRLSPFQTARVWRALARNKAATDPSGCVTAFLKAKSLAKASTDKKTTMIVDSNHPSSSASVVAAAAIGGVYGYHAHDTVGSQTFMSEDEARNAIAVDGSIDAADWLDGGKLSSDDLVALAGAMATLGDNDAAITECRNAIDREPSRGDLYVHLAGALQRKLGVGAWPNGNVENVVATAPGTSEGAQQFGPDFLKLRLGHRAAVALFPSYAQNKNKKDSSFDVTMKADEDDADIWRRICSSYEQAMGLDESLVGASGYFHLGLGRLRLVDRSGALNAFNKAGDIDPSCVDALVFASLILDALAKDKERLDSEDESGIRVAKEDTFKALQNTANALDMLPLDDSLDTDDADDDNTTPIANTLSMLQDGYATSSSLAEVFLRLGDMAKKVGDKDAAVAAFGRVLTVDDQHQEAKKRLSDLHGDVAMTLFWSGSAANKHGDFDKAEELLRECVSLQPHWRDAKIALSFALNRNGKHREAFVLIPTDAHVLISQPSSATESASPSPSSSNSIWSETSVAHDAAVAYFRQGELLEALAQCEEVFEHNVNSELSSFHAELIDLVLKIIAELVDAKAPAARIGRAVQCVLSAGSAINITINNALNSNANTSEYEDAQAQIVDMVQSWLERGLNAESYAALDSLLTIDHERGVQCLNLMSEINQSFSNNNRGVKSATAKEALLTLEDISVAYRNMGDAVKADEMALRVAEFTHLPPYAEMVNKADEAKRQAGRGDFEGAVKTYKGLLRLKSNMRLALNGLIDLSITLRKLRRFDEARDVMTLVRKTAPDYGPGAVEMSQVYSSQGELLGFRGGDMALSLAQHELAVKEGDMASEEGNLEAIFKMAIAYEQISSQSSDASLVDTYGKNCENAYTKARALPVGTSQVHVMRAKALLAMDSVAHQSKLRGAHSSSGSTVDLAMNVRPKLLHQAKFDLARAVQLRGKSCDTATILALAEVYHALGEYQHAVTHLSIVSSRGGEGGEMELGAQAEALLGDVFKAMGTESKSALTSHERAAQLDVDQAGLAARLRSSRIAHGKFLLNRAITESSSLVIGADDEDSRRDTEELISNLEGAISVLTDASRLDQLVAFRPFGTKPKPSHLLSTDHTCASLLSEVHLKLGTHYSDTSLFIRDQGIEHRNQADELELKALDELRLAVKYDGGMMESRVALANILRTRSSRFARMKNMSFAIKDLQSAIHCEEGHDFMACLALARIFQDQQLLGQSLRYFKEAQKRAASHGNEDGYDEAGNLITQLEGSLAEKLAELKQEATLANDPEVALLLGEVYEAMGNLPEAIKSYEQSLQVHPDHSDALFKLASSLLMRYEEVSKDKPADDVETVKLLQDAVSYFRRCVVFSPESAEVNGAAGLAYVKYQRYQDVIASKKLGYIESGGQTPLDRELAWREAADTLSVACNLSPAFVEVFVGLSEAKQALIELDESETLLMHASRLSPNNADTLHRLGQLQISFGEYSKAETYLTQALGLEDAGWSDNDGQVASTTQNNLFVQVRKNLALSVMKLGQLKLESSNSDSDINESIDLLQKSIETDTSLAEPHYHMGNALKKLNRFDEAAKSYHTAQEVFGSSVYSDATAGRASLTLAVGGGVDAPPNVIDEAILGLKQAIREGYSGLFYRFELATTLNLQKRYQDAAVVFRSVIDDTKKELTESTKISEDQKKLFELYAVKAYRGLASVRHAQGNLIGAADSFASIVSLNGDVNARFKHGLELRTAITDHQETKAKKGQSGSDSKAAVSSVAKRQQLQQGAKKSTRELDERFVWQEIERVLSAGIALHSTDPQTTELFLKGCFALGEAQEFLDRKTQAIETYELAVRQDSKNKDIKLSLTEVSLEKEALVRLGRSHLNNHQYSSAVLFLGMAIGNEAVAQTTKTKGKNIKVAPALPGTPEALLGEALTQLGKKHTENGDLTNALDCLDRAAQILPDSALPMHYKGNALLELKQDYEGAAQAQRAAIKQDDSIAIAHTALGTCLEALGQLDPAVLEYQAGIELGEKTPDAYSGLGDTLSTLGGNEDVAAKAAVTKAPTKKGKKGAVVANARSPPTPAQLNARVSAVAAYSSALELDAYHAPALYGIALCLSSLRDYNAALPYFRRANALNIHNGDACFLSAYGNAVTHILDADAKRLALHPLALSVASPPKHKQGRVPPPLVEDVREEYWEEARKVLELCVAAAPMVHYEAYVALAAVRLGWENDPDAAMELISQAIEINKQRAPAHVSSARVLAARGDFDGAITAFLTALSVVSDAGANADVEDATLAKLAGPDLGDCYVAKGLAAMNASAATPRNRRSGNNTSSTGTAPVAASSCFESALEYDPKNESAHSHLADELFSRAMIEDDNDALSSKDSNENSTAGDEAVKLYAAALKHRPDFGAAYCRMGLLLERRGLESEALACVTKAVECDAKIAAAHRALGRLSSDPDDVVAALGSACQLIPSDFALRVQYGAALVSVGRLSEALEAGRLAHALEPYRYEALVVVGDAAEGLEAYPSAAKAFAQAVATVIDSRNKFSVRFTGKMDGEDNNNSAATTAAARAALEDRGKLLERLHEEFRRFESQHKAGSMDSADLVLLMDALGVPASSPSLQVLRDLLAEKAVAAHSGGYSLFHKKKKTEVSLMHLEDWWLSDGSAAAAAPVRTGRTAAVASMQELNTASAIEDEKRSNNDFAPDILSGETRLGLENANLSALYLKLGIAHYRALLNRQEQDFGNDLGEGTEAGGDKSEAESLTLALASYDKPTAHGGPTFAISRAATLGAVSSSAISGGGGELSGEVSWEAAHRAFNHAATERQKEGWPESAEVLFYLGESCEKLGDRARAIDAYTRARIADPSHADSCARLGAIKGSMGDHQAAVKLANEALASEPLHVHGQQVLDAANASLAGHLCDEGEKLIADGDEALEAHGTAAMELFRAAIDQDSSYARAYHLLGNVLEFQGQFAEAAESQRLAVQHGASDGGYAEAHLALGVSLEAQQRTAEAVEHYDLAVRLLPVGSADRVDAQLCLADALCMHGALDQAEAAFVSVGEVANGDLEKAHALFGLGTVHRKRGTDLAASVRALREACGLEPETARYWCALGGAAEALAKRAASGRVDRRRVDESGLWADASAAYGRAIELQDEHWDAVVGLARVRRQQGMKALAVEKLEQVLAAEPRHPDALCFAGAMAAADGKHGEAIRHFASALSQEQQHGESLYHMGNSLFDIGRQEEAIAAYRKCLGISLQAAHVGAKQNDSAAMVAAQAAAAGVAASSAQATALASSDFAHGAAYNLGVVLEQQGDRQGAIWAYELASKLAPFDTDPLVNLGGVLLADQKFDLAVRTYTKAALVDPADPSVQYSLSLALDARGNPGDPEAAKDALDRALGLDPNSTAAQLHAGVMAERSGDYATAAINYRSILRSSKPGPRFYLRLGGALIRDVLLQRVGALYPKGQNPNAALAPETTAEAFAQVGTDLDNPTGATSTINAGAGSAEQPIGTKAIGSLIHREGESDAANRHANTLTYAAGALGTAAQDDEAENAAAVRNQRREQGSAGGGGDGLGSLVRSLSLLHGTSVILAYLKDPSALSGALEVFRSALKLDPRVESRAQLGIGICLELGNDLDGAVDAYSRAVDLNPRDADAYERLGVLLDSLGLHTQGQGAHKIASKLRPKHPDIMLRIISSQARHDGRGLEALAAYRRLLDANPTHAACHYAVGKSLLDLGRAQDAQGPLSIAIQMREDKSLPPIAGYQGALAKCYEELGRANEVERMLHNALKSDPSSAEITYFVGTHHQRCMRHDAAFTSFERVVKDRPSHAQAWHAMAEMYLQRGENKEALEAIRKASDLCKDDASLYFTLGKVLFVAYEAAEASAAHAAESAAQYASEELLAKHRALKGKKKRKKGFFSGVLGSEKNPEDSSDSGGSEEDSESDGNDSDDSDTNVNVYGDDETEAAAVAARKKAGEAARKARAADLAEFATAKEKGRSRLREAEHAFLKATELWGSHRVDYNQKLAQVQGLNGRQEEAIKTLKKCLTPALAERSDAKAKKLEVFKQLAALSAGNMGNATSKINTNLEANLLTSSTTIDERLEEATGYFLEVLRLDAHDPDALVFIGLAHHRQGRGEEALECLSNAADADPSKQLELGRVLMAEGFSLRACRAFRDCIAHDPDCAEARLHLSSCLHASELEDYKGEALELISDAVNRLPPGHVPREFYLTRARIIYEAVLGGDDSASKVTEAAISSLAVGVPYPDLFSLLLGSSAKKAISEAKHFLELALRTAKTIGTWGEDAAATLLDLDASIQYHLAQILILKESALRCRCFTRAMTEAETQTANDLHAQAYAAMTAAVETKPDDIKLVLRRAAIQHGDGLRSESLESYMHALELTPNDAIVHCMLGTVLSEQMRLAPAKKALRAALGCNPNHVPSLCVLGTILRKEGHLDDAVATFQAALAADAQAPHALIGLALTFETLGSLSTAASLYADARKATKGRDPVSLSYLGDVLAARGYVDDALGCYDDAINLDPRGKSCVEAHLGRGLAHWRGGRFLEAEECHRAALAVDKFNADAHHFLADTLRDGACQPIGASQARSGSGTGGKGKTGGGVKDRRGIRARLEESVTEYQAALKLKPDSVEVLDGLGQALLKCTRIDDARDAFLDALALAGPDTDSQIAKARAEEDKKRSLGGGVEAANRGSQRDSDVTERSVSTAVLLTHLGAALLERGDSKAAVEALRSAIRLQPKLGEAYYHMGRAMHARGKTRKAVTAHRTAVEITPDDPNSYVGLGLALIEEGYTDDAVVALKTAIELGGGTDASVNHKLGQAFAGQRLFPFACQALRWCVVQNPRHMEAWFDLAAALRKVGSLLEARAAFHALLEMQPAHSDGLRLLGDTERAIEDDDVVTNGTEKPDASTAVGGSASAILGDVGKFFGVDSLAEQTSASISSATGSGGAGSHAKAEPQDWVRMASRTRPGQVFYYNSRTGKTQWEAPFGVKGIKGGVQGTLRDEEDVLAEKAAEEAKLMGAQSLKQKSKKESERAATLALRPISGVDTAIPSLQVMQMFNSAKRAGVVKTPATLQLLERRRGKLRREMAAAAAGAAPTTWSRISHTFSRKLPLGLVVKGVAATSELGEVTHHWLTVTGFERGQDGSLGLAEESGAIRNNDVIAGVNRTSFLDKTFNDCLKSISMAEWPLTVHLLRDPEKEPNVIEGWAVACKEDGRPLLSAKDEVRLKWQNQKPGPDTFRCYLELRPRTGELFLSRPVPGGGMEATHERGWSMRDVGVVRRVCEKPTSGVGARWCVDLTMNAAEATTKMVVRLQFAGAAEMHVWGETLEQAARLPSLRAKEPVRAGGSQASASASQGGLLAGVDVVNEGEDDDDEEVMDLPALLLQPKSATSLPLDLAGVHEAGGFTYEVEDTEFGPAGPGYEEEEEKVAPVNLYGEEDDEEDNDEHAQKRALKSSGYAASPTLAAKLVGLSDVTRGSEEGSKLTAKKQQTISWVTASITFERRAPLHLVVKGVAKKSIDKKTSKKLAAASGGAVTGPGHWIVVAGFTAREDGSPGPAEASGRIRLADSVVGLNGEPLQEGITFNEFARKVREADWPLTLHTVRDPSADAPDAEGWVARCSLNPVDSSSGDVAAAGLTGRGATDNSSTFVGGRSALSSRRYLELRGRWLHYHRPVAGGAMETRIEGKWDMDKVEVVQGIYDKYAPPGEQWGLALKLQEPVAVAAGSNSMTGHVSIACATEAEMQVWLKVICDWSNFERVRSDARGDRRKGGLKRDSTKPLPVVPTVWVANLDSMERFNGGGAGRVAALRSKIDRMFFEEYDALLALAGSPAPLSWIPPQLPGAENRKDGASGSSSVVSGGALFKQKGLRPKGTKNYSEDTDMDAVTGDEPVLAPESRPDAGRASALVHEEDEAARKLLASALYGTTRLGESPTLGEALFTYQQQLGGSISSPDTRLLVSAVGINATSKVKKDETGLFVELDGMIRATVDGRLPVHDVAIWIYRYARARAKMYLALSKAKRRRVLRSEMTRQERHLVAFALDAEDVADLLTNIQPDDQRDLLKRRSPREAAMVIVELKGTDVTREGMFQLLDPDLRSVVETELQTALAGLLTKRLRENQNAMALTAYKRMNASDGGKALDVLSSDDAALVLDEMGFGKDRDAALARMSPHAAIGARRATDRLYLRKVVGGGGGKGLADRVVALGEVPIEGGIGALTALAREDHHPTPAAAALAAAGGKDPVLAGARSGAACAAELLTGLSDAKLRTALLKKLSTFAAGDILAEMTPSDAATCLAKIKPAEQASMLCAMEPSQADDIVEVMPPDQQQLVGPLVGGGRASFYVLWRESAAEQAATLHKSSWAGTGAFTNTASGRAAFLARLPPSDQADLIDALSASKDRQVLLDCLGPLERMDLSVELGKRHSQGLAALLPADRPDVVAKLPAGALAHTLGGMTIQEVSDIFFRLGDNDIAKLMRRLSQEASPDAVAKVLRLVRPDVAARSLCTLPADERAAMLLQLHRDERDEIMALIGKGVSNRESTQKLAAMADDAKTLGFDPRVAAGEAEFRKEALDEMEKTKSAIADIKRMVSTWEAIPPVQSAEIVRSEKHPAIVTSTVIGLMDARDAAAMFDNLDALAGNEVQAKVLARLPIPIRRDLSHRLGQLLSARLSRGAVSSSTAGVKVPSSIMVARNLAARSAVVGAAVVAASDPKAGWAILQSSRPQARAAIIAAMLPAQKARLATSLETHAAARFVLNLAPRDQAATLLALGKDTQGGVLLAMTPEEQKAILANVQKHGGTQEGGDAQTTSSDTLLAMGPARQALVLGNMPPASAAVLVAPLSLSERASALAGLEPQRRKAILDALPEEVKDEIAEVGSDDEDSNANGAAENAKTPTRRLGSAIKSSSINLGSFMSRGSKKMSKKLSRTESRKGSKSRPSQSPKRSESLSQPMKSDYDSDEGESKGSGGGSSLN